MESNSPLEGAISSIKAQLKGQGLSLVDEPAFVKQGNFMIAQAKVRKGKAQKIYFGLAVSKFNPNDAKVKHEDKCAIRKYGRKKAKRCTCGAKPVQRFNPVIGKVTALQRAIFGNHELSAVSKIKADTQPAE